VVNPGRPDERQAAAKSTNYQLKAGEVISLRTANSAGYGDPRERDVERVLRDVLDEVITAADAERDYGVAIDANLQIDQRRTEELRQA
jgi:N-methylhydantoinase B/oxoprolinase/acetone carboxylase alpha subunit